MLRALAHFLLGDYEVYRIYRRNLEPLEAPPTLGVALGPISSPDALLTSLDPELRTHAVYAGEGAYGYGAWMNGSLVGACWYWTPERYRRHRNFWPLKHDEAKLVQISVSASCQGRGIGQTLMRYAEGRVARQGCRRAYARIWHSNTPSIRLFERVGWEPVALVVVIRPFGARIRLVGRLGGSR